MSWFNASQLSSFAKQALSQAQKSIDRVLDIQEEEPGAWAETISYGEPGTGATAGRAGARVVGSRVGLCPFPRENPARGLPRLWPWRRVLLASSDRDSEHNPRRRVAGPPTLSGADPESVAGSGTTVTHIQRRFCSGPQPALWVFSS